MAKLVHTLHGEIAVPGATRPLGWALGMADGDTSVIHGSNLALEDAPELGFSVTAQALRRWCTPTHMLAITDLADEEKLLFHVIRQAMPGRAKVVLAHVLPHGSASRRGQGKALTEGNGGPVKSARDALERMSHQLRWVGIHCDPILLRGVPKEEIPALVRSRGLERILLTLQGDEPAHSLHRAMVEELLPEVEVPLCTLGRSMPSSPQSEASAGRITLALPPDFECEVPLAFASRLAQEHHAKLTLMYFLDPADKDAGKTHRTLVAAASRLPAPVLREAELLCPVEMIVREGDPAAEILQYVNSTRQDFLILGAAGASRPRASGSDVTRAVVADAHCPVMLLGDAIAAAQSWPRAEEQPRPPQRVFL